MCACSFEVPVIDKVLGKTHNVLLLQIALENGIWSCDKIEFVAIPHLQSFS